MKRIPIIDGLRGIAACAVVLFHFNDRLHIGSWTGSVLDRGAYGVALFFVLSGFVITMTLGNAHIDARFIGRFVLRRSLRLDPPYWCSIALCIAVAVLGTRFGAHQSVPTVGVTIAHVFYLQDILRLPPISPIYWSLCLEIQFYLFVVAILWGRQWAELSIGSFRFQSLVAASILTSILCRHFGVGRGTFVQLWFGFALGAMAFWAVIGAASRRYAVTATAVVGAYALVFHDEPGMVIAASSSLILLAAAFGRLNALGNPIAQFLGRISYSLYLTHSIFGVYALALALRYVSPWLAFLIGSGVTIGSAWLWYRIIELPSIRLSHRFGSPRGLTAELSELPGHMAGSGVASPIS